MSIQPSLATLERVVAKYRSDVHHLPPGAPPPALTALEGHLGLRLPPGLRQFLGQHNGASLFRGSLRIRSAAELALAREGVGRVVLFADGPGDTRWAWAAAPSEEPAEGTDEARPRYAFGQWTGERLDPMHTSFAGWLAGCVAVVESRVTRAEDLDALRLEADPDDPYQQIKAARRALAAGRPDEAEALLTRAVRTDPESVTGWQLLGDATAIRDRGAARTSWLNGFRRTRLPQAWPGEGCLDAEVLRSLSVAFADPEKWERELQRFLAERVLDVVSEEEAELTVTAATQLASSLVQRGQRSQAREVLTELLSRCHVFTRAATPWAALLDLARLEVGLGHHDEAEALLRRLEREGPESLRGEGRLVLAHVAVGRQEPWAEEILDSAEACALDDEGRLQVTLLRLERVVRLNRADQAAPLLDTARALARRIGLRSRHGAVELAAGDVCHLTGDHRQAEAHYQRALDLLEDRSPELRFRVHVRLGDLALHSGDLDEARHRYHTALTGFGRHELPVREAWVMVRLATLLESDPEGGRGGARAQLLEEARDRFVRADLATGVATVDSVGGDPGASLAWHLERATAQARARHDAQRSRPPWIRADAERPERRLGAHRLAIAACGEAVVAALAQEMAACVRATQAGRARAKDPVVLRYVAAVDLLAGHRSYAAAQVLLQHLLGQAVDGVAYRALQGAIARSPNAALVDGLLRCVEQPNAHPARSVAAAAELLGLRREVAAVRPLIRLAGPDHRPAARKAAVAALGRIGKRQAVEHVAVALEDPALAEAAGLALLMLGDRRGIDFHGRALLENRQGLSGHPGELVGRYGGPDHFLLLVGAARGEGDGALGALMGLGLMGDPRAIPVLLESLRSRERKVLEVSAGALAILTGHEEDLDNPGVRNKWIAWCETQAGHFTEGVRHRGGKPFDFGVLIEDMGHRDAWSRRTAYDELVITSGRDLPFDADGPWRVQCAHLEAWKGWWATTRHQVLSGRWYLDGARIH